MSSAAESCILAGGYPHRVLGFFSFTEVTDPSAHEAYNAWHQLDHLPEQFTIDGITFGQRWVRSPRCQAAEASTSPLLDRFHYMTLYLMRGRRGAARVLRPGRTAARRGPLLRRAGAPCCRVRSTWWAAGPHRASPSPAGAVPFRPSHGVYVVVGPAVDGAGVGGARPGWPASGSSPTPRTTAWSRWPSSTVISGGRRPRSGPRSWESGRRSGRAPWSVSMPFAGTGSLR